MNLLEQEERTKAMKDFQNGNKDVLVATDIGAKGLDFPNVQHVINFDMPKDVKTNILKHPIAVKIIWMYFSTQPHTRLKATCIESVVLADSGKQVERQRL